MLNTDWIFLDYMDLLSNRINALRVYQFKAARLAFDLLAFLDTNDQRNVLVFSAPAMAKCKDTAQLIHRYIPFFRNGKLKYVLSQKYAGNFQEYIQLRTSKLRNNFTPQELGNNFEFRGYTSNHWLSVYNSLLTTMPKNQLAKARVADCDYLYRNQVREAFSNNRYVINGLMDKLPSAKHVDNIIHNMISIANSQQLFQRIAIMKKITKKQKLHRTIRLHIQNELDYRFSVANACAAGAVPVNEYPGLNGETLYYISQYIAVPRGQTLQKILIDMTPQQVIRLCEQREWRHWISFLQLLYRDCLTETNGMLVASRPLLLRKSKLQTISHIDRALEISTIFCAAILNKILGATSASISLLLSSLLTNAPSALISYLAKRHATGIYLAHRATQAAIEIQQQENTNAARDTD
ncbi:hypothetical protein ACQZV8_07385 [Magnetococcales bacterium HHB-1]